MAIFDRIRKARGSSPTAVDPSVQEVPSYLLPEINQRVSIASGAQSPVSSRIEDRGRNALQLAFPALELESGDPVTLTWEGERAWMRLETRVTGIDSRSAVPTILVATEGVLSRYDDQRRDVRRLVDLPLELRVVHARAVPVARELHTYAVEVASDQLRFETTAAFSPGDIAEAKVRIGTGVDDVVGVRLRVVRVETLPGSWRSSCIASFDEILRSDRARLLAAADALGTIATQQLVPPPASSEPTTADGVGGRDEPRPLSDLQHVIDYLNHTDPERRAPE